MALSATLSPNVLEYVRKSLNMRDSVRLYTRPMGRPNIMQMIAKIKDPKEFYELAFLVSIASAVSAIPKTMVFVDNLDEGVTLANHLRNLLPAHMKKDGERLIQKFNTILESDTKAQYLEDFRYGDTRIWICTNAAGMRVDIGNIVWVVQ